MYSIFKKEISAFFSSLIAYIVVAVFLVMTGLFMWVFTDTSILYYNYASLDQLFALAPMIFLFLIPAITMRAFAEENQKGTIEFLATKPVSDTDIVLGKYFANLLLVLFAILPTLLYYYSVYQLGSPVGNLDSGGIMGSYIGLIFLAGAFVAIGMWTSSITDNQIIFAGAGDALIAKLGIAHHYDSVSRGVLDSRDVLYFLSVITIFILATLTSLSKRKW